MGVDSSEVDRLLADLTGAPKRVQMRGRKVMKRAAVNIKADMREEFSGHRYAGAVPFSLEFEQRDAAGFAYEIGELDSGGPQWGLAAILAYGTVNNAPVVDHVAPLRREVPAVMRHLGDAGEDAMLGGPG